jgi:hypothetical protein
MPPTGENSDEFLYYNDSSLIYAYSGMMQQLHMGQPMVIQIYRCTIFIIIHYLFLKGCDGKASKSS